MSGEKYVFKVTLCWARSADTNLPQVEIPVVLWLPLGPRDISRASLFSQSWDRVDDGHGKWGICLNWRLFLLFYEASLYWVWDMWRGIEWLFKIHEAHDSYLRFLSNSSIPVCEHTKAAIADLLLSFFSSRRSIAKLFWIEDSTLSIGVCFLDSKVEVR